jgi:hypothetical protein
MTKAKEVPESRGNDLMTEITGCREWITVILSISEGTALLH